MDGEHNHSMGSLMDGTPPQCETDSDRLMKDNWGSPVHRTPHVVITLTSIMINNCTQQSSNTFLK